MQVNFHTFFIVTISKKLCKVICLAGEPIGMTLIFETFYINQYFLIRSLAIADVLPFIEASPELNFLVVKL